MTRRKRLLSDRRTLMHGTAAAGAPALTLALQGNVKQGVGGNPAFMKQDAAGLEKFHDLSDCGYDRECPLPQLN